MQLSCNLCSALAVLEAAAGVPCAVLAAAAAVERAFHCRRPLTFLAFLLDPVNLAAQAMNALRAKYKGVGEDFPAAQSLLFTLKIKGGGRAFVEVNLMTGPTQLSAVAQMYVLINKHLSKRATFSGSFCIPPNFPSCG
jgi:hypothetical protein